MKLLRHSGIAALNITLAAICLLIFSPGVSMAGSAPVTIKMVDKAPFYEPAVVTVKAGTEVQWVNDGTTVHQATTIASEARNKKDVSIPAGATPFDSGFLAPGSEYSYTFKVPGKYHYFCLPHENAGMRGEVVVKK